jgi:hypothetical protein
MKTIYRNATNKILFKLHEDPAKFEEIAVLFRQNGHLVLQKEKSEVSIEEKADHAGKYWDVGVRITPEESMRFHPQNIVFSQMLVLRDGDIQDTGKILELDVLDTAAGDVYCELKH